MAQKVVLFEFELRDFFRKFLGRFLDPFLLLANLAKVVFLNLLRPKFELFMGIGLVLLSRNLLLDIVNDLLCKWLFILPNQIRNQKFFLLLFFFDTAQLRRLQLGAPRFLHHVSLSRWALPGLAIGGDIQWLRDCILIALLGPCVPSYWGLNRRHPTFWRIYSFIFVGRFWATRLGPRKTTGRVNQQFVFRYHPRRHYFVT